MPKYLLKIIPSAEKEFSKVPKKDRERIYIRLEALERDPFPSGYKKLTGSDNCYRIRQGNYRIVYTLKKSHLIV